MVFFAKASASLFVIDQINSKISLDTILRHNFFDNLSNAAIDHVVEKFSIIIFSMHFKGQLSL